MSVCPYYEVRGGGMSFCQRDDDHEGEHELCSKKINDPTQEETMDEDEIPQRIDARYEEAPPRWKFQDVPEGYDMPTLKQRVFEALGAASMAWDETPIGVFNSRRAEEIGEALWAEIQREQSRAIEYEYAVNEGPKAGVAPVQDEARRMMAMDFASRNLLDSHNVLPLAREIHTFLSGSDGQVRESDESIRARAERAEEMNQKLTDKLDVKTTELTALRQEVRASRDALNEKNRQLDNASVDYNRMHAQSVSKTERNEYLESENIRLEADNERLLKERAAQSGIIRRYHEVTGLILTEDGAGVARPMPDNPQA